MSISRVSLYHLETLLWIDRLGTFSAAAERLNTTFDGSELTDGYRPSVWRWTIGAEATSFGATQLDDAPTDFPRIDERRTGLDNRIGYSGHAARWSGDEVVFDGVAISGLRGRELGEPPSLCLGE